MFIRHTGTTTILILLFIISSSSSILCLGLSLLQNNDEITTIIRIGSRPSNLATIQAKAVATHIQRHYPNLKPILVPIQASGDIIDSTTSSSSTTSTTTSTSTPPVQQQPVIQDVPLAFSNNVDFTRTLDDAIIKGHIDIAVHSLKDIPPDHRWNNNNNHNLLKIYCPLQREDCHDVLIGPYKTIQELLTNGAKVGTSSIRRQSQLLYQWRCSTKEQQQQKKKVEIVNLRGNVESRLLALTNGDVDALILARSGLDRIQRQRQQQLLITSLDNDDMQIQYNTIPYNEMLPGTCQGIVAAVVLKGGKFDNNNNEEEGDENNFWNNNNIINEESTLMAYAERQFLNILDLATPWKGRPPLAGILEKYTPSSSSSSSSSIGKETTTLWKFQGLLASTDGKQVISSQKTSLDLQQQGGLGGGGAISALTKEMAISLGEQAAYDILDKAGPYFFDDGGP